MMKALANLSTPQSHLADADVPATSQRARLQRKCACGKMAGPDGECNECRKKRLQREAQNSEAGQPITRGAMEPCLGHDFGRVRVHSDARAVESAPGSKAIAYPVPRDGAIGKGQFRTGPETLPPETQSTPVDQPKAPTPDNEPTPLDNPPIQGPAITVQNGWADPGGKQDRTTVGIGEQNSFAVNDVAGGSWKSVDGKGKTLNSVSFQWTASAAGKNTITYTAADKSTSSITMTTEVPSSLSGKKDSDLTFASGTQGAGMELTVTVSPMTVSFQGLELMEGTCNASAISGYFSSHAPGPHDAAAGAGKWRQVGTKNDVSDTADSSGWPSPWSKGSYTWSIPASWRLAGAQTSTAFSTNNDQVVSITGADGETIVTKLGAKTDPRKPGTKAANP